MTNKTDIKIAAFTLFAEKGFAETSLNEIAQAVGLKKQSLYSHYESKNSIIRDVVTDHADMINRNFDAVFKELCNQNIKTIFAGIFKVFVDIFSVPERYRLWKRMILLQEDKEFTELLHNIDWQLNEKLQDKLYAITSTACSEPPDPDTLHSFIMTFMMMIYGYLEYEHSLGCWEVPWQKAWSSFCSGAAEYFTE